ncbi:MAG: CDP-alcohol phosphatidyltransferase family protein [Acidobacteriota bacterium]
MKITLATKITILRILILPFLIVSLINQKSGMALFLFVLAGVTDGLDGFIARKLNQRSDLGMVLDPLADKFLVNSTFILLTFSSLEFVNRVPLYLGLTVLIRDASLLLGALLIKISFGKKRFFPSILGKISTSSQILTLFLVLLGNHFQQNFGYLRYLFLITFIFTLISGLDYFYKSFISLVKTSSAG